MEKFMKHGTAVIEQELEPLVGLFRLLSDKTRLSILMLLATGEKNVGSLCVELNLPQPTVSHHLGLLRMQISFPTAETGSRCSTGSMAMSMHRPETNFISLSIDSVCGSM